MAEDTKSAEPTLGTQLQTFLIADVRGYTAYTHQYGDEEASRLAARFAAVVRETVPAYEGQLVELRGDEALCLFSSARQALRSAVELERRFSDTSEGVEPFPLGVGIGLDLGEAVPTEGGYRGAVLNLAARLCSQAAPGQILVSDGLVHAAGRVTGVDLRPLKPIRLKGLPDPVRPFEVVVGEPSVVTARRHSRRWPLLVGAGVVLLALLALGARALQGSSAKQSPAQVLQGLLSARHDAIAVLDAHTGKLLDALSGPRGSAEMATTTSGEVWLASAAQQRLYGFDSASKKLRQSISLHVMPTAIAAGQSGLWIASGPSRMVGLIKPGSDRVTFQHEPGCCGGASSVTELANDPLLSDGNGLRRLNPQTGAPVEPYLTTPTAFASVSPDLTIWASDGWSRLVRIRPFNDTIIGQWHLRAPNGEPAQPGQMIAAQGRLWEVAPGENAVLVLGGGRPLVRKITVPGRPTALAYGDGAIWVADSAAGAITRIDPGGERVTATYRIGGWPTGITASGGEVWATVQPRQAALDAPGVIAYDDNGDIYTINADGTDRRRLTHSQPGFWAVSPNWSPDGRWIAFSAGPRNWQSTQFQPASPKTRMEIYAMRADGSDMHRLTNANIGRYGAFIPAWSPDGRHIAYGTLISVNGWGVGDTWVMNADGSDPHPLTHHRGNSTAFNPVGWTPDGKHVLISEQIDTEQAASQPTRVAMTALTGRIDGWLPNTLNGASSGNRTRILFATTASDGLKKIFETNGQGRDRWLLVPNPQQQFNVLPVWSPDQSRIAYSGSWETTLALYVLRDDGTGTVRLSSDFAAGDPAWKPTP